MIFGVVPSEILVTVTRKIVIFSVGLLISEISESDRESGIIPLFARLEGRVTAAINSGITLSDSSHGFNKRNKLTA